MRPRRPLALALAVACSGLACSGAPPPAATKASPPDPSPSLRPFASPARWLVRPAEVGEVTARLETDAGCLYATQRGHRWLANRLTKGGCEATATPAPDGAGEPLVALFTRGSELVAVGDTGSLFFAPSALAPFERAVRASRSLRAASGSAELVLAASRGGVLLALRGSATGSQSFTEAGGLPAAARVADVAVRGKAAIVLAMPERVFVSADGARSFEAVKLGPIGAHRAAVARDGALVVTGHRGNVVWRPSASGFDPSAGLSIEAQVELGARARPTRAALPSAEAVQGGSATLVGERYFQVVRASDAPAHARGDGAPWALASGKLDGALTHRGLEFTRGCAGVTVGGALGKLAFACVDEAGEHDLVRVYLSDDAATKAELVATLERAPTTEEPRVALGASGTMLVTGACVGKASAHCRPGPVLVSPVGGTWSARHATVGDLQGPPDAVAFAPDGVRAYFLGRRAKDDKPALFSSSDRGATFSSVALELPPDPEDGAAQGDFAEPLPYGGPSVDEDGTVGFGVAVDAGLAWATVDEAGRLTVQAPEGQTERIAGHGKRALVMSLRHDAEGDAATVFAETIDGGASWTPLEAPAALAEGIADVYESGLACGHAGCVVGPGTVRLGWGGDAPSPTALPARPVPPPPVDPSRATLVCETVATAGWQRLDGAHGQAPSGHRVARGKSLWSLLTESADGEVVVHASDFPEGNSPPKLKKSVLLGKRPPGRRSFDHVERALGEGIVGMRLTLPPKKSPDERDEGKPMRDVELAWEHVIEGTSGRARLPDAGLVEPGDLPGQRLAGVVSMSRKGVFVRPHHRAEGKTYFAEPGGKVRELHVPALPSGPPSSRSGLALVSGPSGDEPLAVGVSYGEAGGGRVLLLGKSPRGFATKADEPWTFSYTALSRGPDDELAESTRDWAHVGGRALGVVLTTSIVGGEAFGTYAPLLATGGLGEPVDLPTPFDLPSAPRPCTASERRDTPRAAYDAWGVPFGRLAGTRHLVVVNDPPPGTPKGSPSTPSRSLSLVTEQVVVHGTKAAPCVAAWTAQARYVVQQLGEPAADLSAVIAGDPKHAWLVRARRGASTEVRPMRCKLDPSAPTVDFAPGGFGP